MRPPEEDIYITVVVVRRPVSVASGDPDPQALAQSVLDGLYAQDTFPLGNFPVNGRRRWQQATQPGSQLFAGGWPNPPKKQPKAQKRRWWLLAVAIACWVGAALSFYMLWK